MAEGLVTRQLSGWIGPTDAGVPDDREDRLLPWASVRLIAGISRTTAWRLQQTGEFPDPVPISANRVGWWESELTAWKARRRMTNQPRPRPFSEAGLLRRPAKAGRFGRTAAIAERPNEPQAPSPQPVEADRPRRRGRAKAVSPDQIDFGF